jgi:hypothetical protein
MSEGSRITHVLVSERISGTKAEKFLKGATKAYTKNGKKKVVLVDCKSRRAIVVWLLFGASLCSRRASGTFSQGYSIRLNMARDWANRLTT